MTPEEVKNWNKNHPPQWPEGVPTRARIQKLIQPLEANKVGQTYLVNKVKDGFIRVRVNAFGPSSLLEPVKDLLGKTYACMITTGTGESSWGTQELLVGPKPGVEHAFLRGLGARRKGRKPHLAVCQAMVREDVWQEALKFETTCYDPKTSKFEARRIDYFRAEALDYYNKVNTAVVRRKEFEARRSSLSVEEFDDYYALLDIERTLKDNNVIGQGLDNKEGYCPGFGIRDAWDLAMSLNPSGKDLEDFLNTVAETVFIHFSLSMLRFQWHQGTSTGPQFGEWGRHKQWSQAMARIAEVTLKKQEEER